ncbi:MAG: hypothetical protein FJZ12_04310 [Candidatus Omnitrophica bacterium]|nr:hypothetical protein [Candidatus Omnitrophota bacterium]
MNRIYTLVLLVFTLPFCLGACADCNLKTENVDVNNDGKPDVAYLHDGQNIRKIKADTNYDGKDDVIVHIEDGKFKKAEVDSDHDGSYETKIDNEAQFKKWVNENRPDFNDHLGWDDYSRKIDKVFWKPGEHN